MRKESWLDGEGDGEGKSVFYRAHQTLTFSQGLGLRTVTWQNENSKTPLDFVLQILQRESQSTPSQALAQGWPSLAWDLGRYVYLGLGPYFQKIEEDPDLWLSFLQGFCAYASIVSWPLPLASQSWVCATTRSQSRAVTWPPTVPSQSPNAGARS